jgi:hypothetical protein
MVRPAWAMWGYPVQKENEEWILLPIQIHQHGVTSCPLHLPRSLLHFPMGAVSCSSQPLVILCPLSPLEP